MSDDQDEKNRARAAQAAADLKETEDLLAGFDRPGRTPRTPAVRDFVDFHSRKGSDPNIVNVAKGNKPDAAPAGDDKRALPTFVLPKESRQFPSWLMWALAMLAMAGGGAAFAWYLVTSGDRDNTSSSVPSTSAATTISQGSAPTGNAASDRDVPPPPPPPKAAPSPTVDNSDTPSTMTTTTTTTTATTSLPAPTPSSPSLHPATSAPHPSTSSAPPPSTSAPPTPSANPEFIRNL